MQIAAYVNHKFPEPRPFQQSARTLLREAFVDGHRCQMVMSPTGSGKTILAMFLINESLARGRRVILVDNGICELIYCLLTRECHTSAHDD